MDDQIQSPMKRAPGGGTAAEVGHGGGDGQSCGTKKKRERERDREKEREGYISRERERERESGGQGSSSSSSPLLVNWDLMGSLGVPLDSTLFQLPASFVGF